MAEPRARGYGHCMRNKPVSPVSPRWVTLVGLVLLVAVAGAAFVDYEIVRADADAARIEAATVRAGCLYGTRAASPAERRQRHARCDRLPGPLREAARVERRWERRAPWYGFAAGAILLATTVMFVQSRRRHVASASLDSAETRRWRVATLAVRSAVGIVLWGALVYLVVDRWTSLVGATGGSTHDCHYPENDCGVLGEFAEAHPLILLLLVVAVAALPAAAISSMLGRFFASLGDPGRRQAGPPVPQH